MQGGFRESPLRLNERLGSLEAWNEAAIQARAQRLAEQAAQVWAAPVLSAEVLATYRPKSNRPEGYTLSDHVRLADGRPARALFDALRKEILALDPCVTEDILKHYVAYKAENNFVCVVPKAKRLRLFLGIRLEEIHDTQSRCSDYANRSHWGTGDVMVHLASLEELPYVMGLVRQAFEKQMGDLEAEV